MIPIEQISEHLDREHSHDRFSGAVLISQSGQEPFQKAYGLATRSWGIKNNLDTRFRVASISKMFTAVAVLQLIDNGEIDLDSPIAEILDLNGTQIPDAVTIYHLLTMTSGIADWFDESGDWEANWAELIRTYPIYLFRENKDYLPLFLNEPPPAAVGEKYHYNGAGYILLGLAIEKITGQSYPDAISDRIFAMADMDNSGFFGLDDVVKNVAEGYVQAEQKEGSRTAQVWKKNIYSTTPEAAADGGASSTVGDLYRFSSALRTGELLSSDMTKAILSPQVRSMDERFRGYTWMYGFGNIFLLDDDSKIVRWGHTGEEDGVSCRLYYYPEHEVDVILLANQSWCTLDLGWEIHDLIVGSR